MFQFFDIRNVHNFVFSISTWILISWCFVNAEGCSADCTDHIGPGFWWCRPGSSVIIIIVINLCVLANNDWSLHPQKFWPPWVALKIFDSPPFWGRGGGKYFDQYSQSLHSYTCIYLYVAINVNATMLSNYNNFLEQTWYHGFNQVLIF